MILFFILFLIIGAIIYYWIKGFYIEQTKESLLNNIDLISFELQKDTNLDLLAKHIKDTLHTRLTVISNDGVVIAESHKDKTKMDNHKYRDEIMQASKEKFGYKIRHSHTLNKDLLYVAKKYNINKTFIYIRLAKELVSIDHQIISLGVKILLVLIIFFFIIFFITYKISKEIESETQKIVNFLNSLVKKRKLTYINSDFSVEFFKITKHLSKISQILTKKDKQKAKYTKKLQISNKQKDDIISAISHEFKNPIAVINGYCQTLLDDEDINKNIRKKFLEKIYKNGDKLSSLIDTLRLSIKLDSGQQQTNFTTINLYNLLYESIENMKINYNKRETIIKGDKNITIKVDPTLFEVVINNLIENAYKYSEDEVIINFNQNRVDIIDSGIGISSKNLENITEKFYRVGSNNWNNSLGLGLFIVNNIITLHNFKLEIKSQENKGSTFSIIF